MPAKKKPVAARQSKSSLKDDICTNAPNVHRAPAKAHDKKTRLEENRSAMASKAKTKVPTINPSCKAEVRRPTADEGHPICCCRSGMTALIANHNEVPANCAKTRMGRMRFGVEDMFYDYTIFPLHFDRLCLKKSKSMLSI